VITKQSTRILFFVSLFFTANVYKLESRHPRRSKTGRHRRTRPAYIAIERYAFGIFKHRPVSVRLTQITVYCRTARRAMWTASTLGHITRGRGAGENFHAALHTAGTPAAHFRARRQAWSYMPHHDFTGASCVISIIIIMRALVSHTWWWHARTDHTHVVAARGQPAGRNATGTMARGVARTRARHACLHARTAHGLFDRHVACTDGTRSIRPTRCTRDTGWSS
jgi:hypothetical protein